MGVGMCVYFIVRIRVCLVYIAVRDVEVNIMCVPL